MFTESDLKMEVVIPIESLEINEVIPYSKVMTCVLKNLMRPSKEKGYYIAITEVKEIGNGSVRKDEDDITDRGNVIIPVHLCCRSFLPMIGETMVGIVYNVYVRIVVLKSGPLQFIHIPRERMPDFNFVPSSEEYVRSDLSRIKVGTVVRFLVVRRLWNIKNKEFLAYGSLEGDGLGPVSLEEDD